nr:Virion membrane protein, poxvirus L1-related [Abalone asfa-like virus]
MGNGGSKVSTKIINESVSNFVFTQTQACQSKNRADNVLRIDGNKNNVEDISQTIDLAITADCASKVANNNDFQRELSSKIGQELKAQGVALTEFLNTRGDAQSAHLENLITTNVRSDIVQNCLNELVTKNVIDVVGEGNLVKGVDQVQNASLFTTCLQDTETTNSAFEKIANTANQYTESLSTNPFSVVTDAIQSFVNGGVGIVALFVIGFIILVIGIVYLKKASQPKPVHYEPIGDF